MTDAGVLRDSMQLVERIFRQNREILLESFGNASYQLKDDRSMVTKLDVTVEESLRDALLTAFPQFGFRGEETGHVGSDTTYWIVDPIDGTSSFVRGLPYATNMAAFIENGETKAALIYDFIHDVLYTASKGQGAFRNGESLRIAPEDRFEDQVVYVLGGRLFDQSREAFRVLDVKALLPLTASGHAYTMLSEGAIDGVAQIDPGAKLHDVAPGLLIAEEAGLMLYCLDEAEGITRSRYVIGRPSLIEKVESSGLF